MILLLRVVVIVSAPIPVHLYYTIFFKKKKLINALGNNYATSMFLLYLFFLSNKLIIP
jgi:hypothetical protein